jgi:hypothetical protein
MLGNWEGEGEVGEVAGDGSLPSRVELDPCSSISPLIRAESWCLQHSFWVDCWGGKINTSFINALFLWTSVCVAGEGEMARGL